MNGVKSKLLSATRGLAVMTTTFAGYRTYAGDFPGRDRGNMISLAQGAVTSYSIENAQKRGLMFSAVGDDVYENQIIGISARPQDVKVNVCKTKTLDNMRSAGKDDNSKIVPPQLMTLEESIEYIIDGEYVEITPDAVRMGTFDRKVDKSKSTKR